jgi:hypothetical protein
MMDGRRKNLHTSLQVTGVPQPWRLAEVLDLMRQAQERGIVLRLWGSLGIEHHSPSFHRLGLHETHADVDLTARASQQSDALDFFESLGFGEPDWRNQGSAGAGWVLLKDAQDRQVEIAFVHALDSSILNRSAVTLPIEYLLHRSLVGVIEPHSCRAHELFALLLSHDLVESAANEEEISLGLLRPLLSLYPHHVGYSLGSASMSIQDVKMTDHDRELVTARLETLADEAFKLRSASEPELAWMFVAWGLLPLERMGPYMPQLQARLTELLRAET